MATWTHRKKRRTDVRIGVSGVTAAVLWWYVADPSYWLQRMARNPMWAWNHLAANLGIELLLLSSLGSFPCRLPRLSFWWTRCCGAFGIAMAYGAALAQDDPTKSALFYSLCGVTALAFLLTGRLDYAKSGRGNFFGCRGCP